MAPEEASVFWFERVTPSENSVEARIGCTGEALMVRRSIYDRLLWYDVSPSVDAQTYWDATTLYLDLNA